ncbi:MAG: SpoIIE family protein phosphatase [Acidobacteriaceae bacterium]|nr:SpoIIE family protein phosphatase [Acidobacteriaceae bacterium]MBV9779884.1 SpoIIE family protein phosphatase [Acidobacteriaceae bacterium]
MTLEAVEPKTDIYKVLVVDDQADIREALRLLLKRAGYSIQMAASPIEALAAAARSDHDLILMDMNFASDTTSGREGLELLELLHTQQREVPIIAMTGWSTIELAVEAMQRGACDFVPKPWDSHHMLAVLEKHLKANRSDRKSDAREAELAIARNVQRKLLPQPYLSACGLECECVSMPAGEISGDLYDFFEIDGQAVAFLLGDVSGKGIGAALLMANLQATIRSQQDLARSPAKLLDRVNQLFFQFTRPEHYATLFLGVYEARTRTVRYVNCGHPAPVLLRANGECELLESTSMVLGAFNGCVFGEATISLSPGDRLILFSDGLSEAKLDKMDDGWLIDSIQRFARRYKSDLAAVLAASAGSPHEQADDITVMDVRVQSA